jgi:glucokinase
MEKLLCGVDLGGTKLALVLTNESGQIRDKLVVYDHVTKSDGDITDYICDLIEKLLLRNEVCDTDLEGIGVCFPGHVRYREGITITTSNLQGFKNFPLQQKILQRFQTRVLVDNDANAQTYAEFLYGAGKGYDDMLFMTISSGIGGGIVLDRKLYRGTTGTAGEFGHMIIDPHSTIRCGCGNYGCLMGCASGLSLPQVLKKYLDLGYKTNVEMKNPSEFDGRMLKAGLDENDLLCQIIVSEYANYLGIGLYNLFQIFNPPVIVLGGGLMKLGDEFFESVQKQFYTLVRDMLFDEIQITVSNLEEDAGVIGAAAMLLE